MKTSINMADLQKRLERLERMLLPDESQSYGRYYLQRHQEAADLLAKKIAQKEGKCSASNAKPILS